MHDSNNTIAGWVLFAGIVALGTSIVSGEIFNGERPEKMGYPIAGVVEEGAGPAVVVAPIEARMQTAEEAKGEAVFKKCTACHNDDNGGPNQLGPNLWGVLGHPRAAHPGFAYSDALKGKPGTWDFKSLDEWLTSPKAYAPGTKMTFAGLGDPMDRANVIAFLNSHGSNLPMPAAPAAAPAAAGAATPADKAKGEANGAGAQKAANVPVLTPEQAAKGGQKNSGGDAAKVSQ